MGRILQLKCLKIIISYLHQWNRFYRGGFLLVRSVDHAEHPQNHNGEGKTECSDNLCQWTNNHSFHTIKAGSGAQQASFPLGSGGSLPEVKRRNRDSDHSSPSSFEVKNDGAVPQLSHKTIKLNSVALVCKRTTQTERPPHIGRC
jgi:hypothetical protein